MADQSPTSSVDRQIARLLDPFSSTICELTNQGETDIADASSSAPSSAPRTGRTTPQQALVAPRFAHRHQGKNAKHERSSDAGGGHPQSAAQQRHALLRQRPPPGPRRGDRRVVHPLEIRPGRGPGYESQAPQAAGIRPGQPRSSAKARTPRHATHPITRSSTRPSYVTPNPSHLGNFVTADTTPSPSAQCGTFHRGFAGGRRWTADSAEQVESSSYPPLVCLRAAPTGIAKCRDDGPVGGTSRPAWEWLARSGCPFTMGRRRAHN